MIHLEAVYYLILLPVGIPAFAEQDNPKIWNKNTFSPLWSSKHGLSCSRDNALAFPEDSLVQLDPRFFSYVSEIILPAQKGLIELRAHQDFSCSGVEPRRLSLSPASSPDKWLDPGNWKGPQYLPHLEKIPCWYDKAIVNPPFRIEFPQNPIRCGSLSISGEVFTSSSSLRYFASHSESFLFSNTPHNDSTLSGGASCPNESGCVCGNEGFREEICENASCDYACSSGIKPKNHCCYNICGALVHFQSYDDQNAVKMSALDRIIRSSYYEKNANIEYHISKTSETEYEVILVNTKGGPITKAFASARRVEMALKRNYGDTSRYYIWSEYSGTDSLSASRARKAFIGIFGAIVIGGLAYVAAKAFRRQDSGILLGLDAYRESVAKTINEWRQPSTEESFSRFENPDVELREPDGRCPDESPPVPPGFSFKELQSNEDKGFENPAYTDEALDENVIQDITGITNPSYAVDGEDDIKDEERIRDRIGIDNPTYGGVCEDKESSDEHRIRDRMGLDNPLYGLENNGNQERQEDQSDDSKIRDRIGLDNPLYGLETETNQREEEEEGDSKISDRIGLDNPLYDLEEDHIQGVGKKDTHIQDRSGIENPIYSDIKDDIDDKIRDRLGIDNPVYTEGIKDGSEKSNLLIVEELKEGGSTALDNNPQDGESKEQEKERTEVKEGIHSQYDESMKEETVKDNPPSQNEETQKQGKQCGTEDNLMNQDGATTIKQEGETATKSDLEEVLTQSKDDSSSKGSEESTS